MNSSSLVYGSQKGVVALLAFWVNCPPRATQTEVRLLPWVGPAPIGGG